LDNIDIYAELLTISMATVIIMGIHGCHLTNELVNDENVRKLRKLDFINVSISE